MTALPDTLRLAASTRNLGVPGALFELELPMRRKNSYRFPVGPADNSGAVHISAAQLAGMVGAINDLLPMDYVGLAAGWTGEIRVRPVNKSSVRRLESAFDIWGHTGIYPAGFVDALHALDRQLSSLGADAVIDVEASATPEGSVRISVEPLPAQG